MLLLTATANAGSFPDAFRYPVFAIGAPKILPLGDDELLPFPFSTIRRMEGDTMVVLYVSTIQGSYLCTQTATSNPIGKLPKYSSVDTGKRPEGVYLVWNRSRTVLTVVHPSSSVELTSLEPKITPPPPYVASTVMRGGQARGTQEGLTRTHRRRRLLRGPCSLGRCRWLEGCPSVQ